MLYVAHLTVTAATSATSPVMETLPVIPGKLAQVDVIVPSGCADLVRLQIRRLGVCICPATPDLYLAGNGTHHRFPYAYEVRDLPYSFDLVAWNLSTNNDHVIWVGLTMHPLEMTLLGQIAAAVGGVRA